MQCLKQIIKYYIYIYTLIHLFVIHTYIHFCYTYIYIYIYIYNKERNTRLIWICIWQKQEYVCNWDIYINLYIETDWWTARVRERERVCVCERERERIYFSRANQLEIASVKLHEIFSPIFISLLYWNTVIFVLYYLIFKTKKYNKNISEFRYYIYFYISDFKNRIFLYLIIPILNTFLYSKNIPKKSSRILTLFAYL